MERQVKQFAASWGKARNHIGGHLRCGKRAFLIACLSVSLFAMAACSSDEENTPETAPPSATAPDVSAAEAAPAQVAVKPPAFGDVVPELRRIVRQASLRPGHEIDEEIPFYRIDVAMDADFMTYSGSVEVWVKNRSKAPWSYLTFHLYPNVKAIAGSLRHLRIDSASIEGEEVVGRDLVNTYELPLGSTLEPGESVSVKLNFRGLLKRARIHESDPASELLEIVLGMFSGKPGDWGIFAYSSRTASLSLWYPVLAAYDDSGWDVVPADDVGDFSYFDVADYLVNFNIDRAWRVEATGTVEDHGDGLRTIRAGAVRELTVIASTVLIPEQRKAGHNGDIIVRSYARVGSERTRRVVLETAADAIAVFEKHFGPYPYTELDIIEADLFGGAGGVEFPGLTTIASFLYMDGWEDITEEGADLMDSRFLRESIQFVVAHEVSHQWWNAVVGSHSRNHPFLDEALAMYSSLLYFREVHGGTAETRQRIIELELPYELHRFLGGSDMPVDQPTSAFTDLVGYSAIVYAKGGLYMVALEELLGSEAFFAGMKRYYEQFQFAIASPGDLQRSLGEGLSTAKVEELAAAGRRWLSQTHGDEDIGTFDPAAVVPLLLAELGVELDGFFLSMLKEEGFWELVKVTANFVEGKDDPFHNVRLDVLTKWGTSTVQKLLWDILL
jgi:hypothetical protein